MLKALRLIVAVALTFVIMLPMESLAASSTEESSSSKVVTDEIFLTVNNKDTATADVMIESTHAAAEGITSLQFSLDLGANAENADFQFSEELRDVEIQEYRYNSSNGKMTIYLSGKNPLFQNKSDSEGSENSFLNVGTLTLSDAISKVSVVDDSLKYVYGTSVNEQSISKNADIAKVSVDTNISGVNLNISSDHNTSQAAGSASLYGLTGHTVTVSAPEKVDNYELVSWINTATGEAVANNMAEYSFELTEPISLRAHYEVMASTDPAVTVTGGKITKVNGIAVSDEAVTTGNYKLNTILTVVPDENDGKNFVGWYMIEDGNEIFISSSSTYQFYLKDPIAIVAKFEAAPKEPEPTVALMGCVRTADDTGKQTVKIGITVDVPDGYEVVSEGILRTYKDLGEEMKIGASGVTNNASKTKFKKGSYTYTFTIAKNSANRTKTVYARGYVKYKDSEGNTTTLYTTNIKELSAIQ